MSHIPHAFRPSAEPLEPLVVLSSIAPALAVSGSPIVETLTTDKPVYKVGQPIKITLSATNTTNANVVLPTRMQVGGFTVSRDFKNVWKSRPGRRQAASISLQPGQTQDLHGHVERPSQRRLTFTFGVSHPAPYRLITPWRTTR